MSKPFRTATQTRRGARGGFPEHDDFEGLPVRQWRQEYVHVAPPSQSEASQQNDRWAIELPFGLPKEYPLLPPHTQELLRAARSGRLYKRPAPEEEDGDAEASDIKGEKKDAEQAAEGFTVKTWKQMPRNVEVPAVSHLAKRPRNIITLASKTLAPQITGPTVRRVTVRLTDAAGNPYERTITLSEGQTVDGEIISESIVPAPTATATELAPQQPTPVRRRPPPPKRKPKGPGRGRKKKLPLPIPLPRKEPGEGGEATGVKDESVGPDGVKIEDGEDSTMQDSEMADNSAMPSDEDEGDEGDDGEEGEGDEAGEEGSQTPDVRESSNQDQDQDQEMTDAQPPEVIHPTSIEEPEEPQRTPSSEEDITITKPRLPPPSLGSLGPLHGLTPPNIGGSPLKNVIIQSPTDPSPMVSPQVASAGGSFTSSSYMDVHTTSMSVDANGTTVSETFVSETVVESVQEALPVEGSLTTSSNNNVPAPLPENPRVEEIPDARESPVPATANIDTATEPKQESPVAPVPEIVEPVAESIAEPASKTTPPAPEAPPPEVQQNSAPRSPLEPPKSPTLLPAVTEDEDDGLNLLGSLERELDRQEKVSSAGSSSDEAQKVSPPAVVAEPEPVNPTPAEEAGVEKTE